MIEKTDKRQHLRFDARIEIQFLSGQEYKLAYSKNISKGGIFLEAESLPDPNAVVELVLDLSELHSDRISWQKEKLKEVRIEGRVVRLVTVAEGGKTIHKVAIQFLNMPPSTQVLFDEIYESF